MARESHEAGHTVQFTFTSSVGPDLAPTFAVYDGGGTMVDSFAAVSSNSTHYYALYTTPTGSDGVYMGEWLAVKTFAGSARNFKRRFLFNVHTTQVD